jgi:hypothetical protein
VAIIGEVPLVVAGEIIFDKLAKLYEGVITLTVLAAC